MIYPENPFVEVRLIQKDVYAFHGKNADDDGYVWMYLIVGSKKAMLIDTGFGVGDLKKLCDVISGGRELVVANTHAHPDHAYGNCRFDAVYCHPYSFHELRMQNESMWNSLFNGDGKGIWMNFTRNDLPSFKKYKILECSEGMVFDLGDGPQIEVIDTPGHHSGHICFLDRKHRILFAGDSVCSEEIHAEGPWPGQLHSEYSTIYAYLHGISSLYLRKNDFDTVFPSHGDISLQKDVIRSILQTCCSIIANPDCYDKEVPANNGQKCFFKHIDGLGMIVYRDVVL